MWFPPKLLDAKVYLQLLSNSPMGTPMGKLSVSVDSLSWRILLGVRHRNLLIRWSLFLESPGQ